MKPFLPIILVSRAFSEGDYNLTRHPGNVINIAKTARSICSDNTFQSQVGWYAGGATLRVLPSRALPTLAPTAGPEF